MTDVPTLLLTWTAPAHDDAATNAAVADAAETALRRLGLPAVPIVAEHVVAEELTLHMRGSDGSNANGYAERVGFAITLGSSVPDPGSTEQRWSALTAGPGRLTSFVWWWARLTVESIGSGLLLEPVTAQVREWVGADDQVADTVLGAVRYLLDNTLCRAGEWPLLRRLAEISPGRVGVVGEQFAAREFLPVELCAARADIARMAAHNAASSGVVERQVQYDLDALTASMVPPMQLVVDDTIPPGWLIIRHAGRHLDIVPLPAEGRMFVPGGPASAALPEVFLPSHADFDVRESDGDDVDSYLAVLIRMTVERWIDRLLSLRDTRRLLDSLASGWDAALVRTLRELMGDEAITNTIRTWLDSGKPAGSIQVLVRELMAAPADSINERMSLGLEAAGRLTERPPA